MRFLLWTLLAAWCGCRVLAKDDSQPAGDAPGQGTEAKFVVTDCVSFVEGKPASKLTVKFRLDDNFQSYVSARFTYPRQNVIKDVKVGQVYDFTFMEDEAAHNLKSAVLMDENRAPDTISDRSLIARVVEVTDTSVVVEWKKDECIKRFFSRENVFLIWNARVFAAGQTIKIAFGPDNRHCKGYLIVDERKNSSGKGDDTDK